MYCLCDYKCNNENIILNCLSIEKNCCKIFINMNAPKGATLDCSAQRVARSGHVIILNVEILPTGNPFRACFILGVDSTDR
jgi:hypothetical protein